MKLYFVRHGESTANVMKEFSNSGHKHPLTEKGLAQAQALARELFDLRFQRIYTSPVWRATQTAQILSENLHVPVEVTEALREWSVGIYEGTRDQVGWNLHRKVQEDWLYQGKLDSRMPGGESFLEIQARFVPFMDELIRNGRGSDHSILLVAHGGLYLTMLPVILNNVDRVAVHHYGFPYTGCVIAETGMDSLTCLSWCGMPPHSLAG